MSNFHISYDYKPVQSKRPKNVYKNKVSKGLLLAERAYLFALHEKLANEAVIHSLSMLY